MRNLKDTDYAFASAKIRAVESRLIDRVRLERMIDAADDDDALKVCLEAGWDVSGGWEEALAREAARVFAYLLEIAPDPELVRLFQTEHDCHNLKVALKSGLGGARGPDGSLPWSMLGTVPPERIEAVVREESSGILPGPLSDALGMARAAYAATRDPQSIDAALDAASFEALRRRSEASGVGLLAKLAEEGADLVNLRSFLRVKRISGSEEHFRRSFVPGGRIAEKVFLALMAQPPEALVKETASAPWGGIVAPALAAYAATGTLTDLEKRSDDRLLDLTRPAKFLSMGAETLIAWLFAKRAEEKNVRIVFVGRDSGTPAETIRERLREPYA